MQMRSHWSGEKTRLRSAVSTVYVVAGDVVAGESLLAEREDMAAERFVKWGNADENDLAQRGVEVCPPPRFSHE